MTLVLIIKIVVSVILLAVSAEFLVRTASAMALNLGVSPIFVGLTVVGIGTSSPELASSLSATYHGIPDISVSNIVGSNIFNIGIILGLTAVLSPISIAYARLKSDLKVAFAAGFVPVLAFIMGTASQRAIGAISLMALGVYILNAYRKDIALELIAQRAEPTEDVKNIALPQPARTSAKQIALQLFVIIVSLVVLILSSSRFVVDATELARAFGLTERVIGLTIVAVGTSLPELVTSLVAVRQKCTDLAVGNVIGSNIFNSLGIFGVCAVVGPQGLPLSTLYTDIPVMLLFTVSLFPLIITGNVISRKEGVALLCAYTIYCAYLIFSTGA